MDGSNQNGFPVFREDLGYEDIEHDASWTPPPNPGEQFQYSQSHPAQNGFQQYHSAQPAYNPYDLSHQPTPTYASSFSSGPYLSQYQPQHQSQHVRPSDMFASTSYNVDPSLQAYHAPGSSFSFSTPANSATISPDSLQYPTPSNHPVNSGSINSMFQQPGNNYTPPFHEHSLFHRASNGDILNNGSSLQYSALPKVPASTEHNSKPIEKRKFETVIPTGNASRSLPAKTETIHNPLRITHPELLVTPSPILHAPWVFVDETPIQVDTTLKCQYMFLENPFLLPA